MSIVFAAVFSRLPCVPGSIWHRLQYVLGFQALGHQVLVLEEIDPSACVDEHGRRCSVEVSMNRRLFVKTMRRFGLETRSCQVTPEGAVLGMTPADLTRTLAQADLLVNLSGHVHLPQVLERVRRRVYVDQDPVYTQLWVSEYRHDIGLETHDVFFTVGLNIGTPRSRIPDCGVRWRHTLPPVVSGLWDGRTNGGRSSPFTTIASLSGYADLEHRGRWYRSKADQLTRFSGLAAQTNQQLELALKAPHDHAPLVETLTHGGWCVVDAATIGDLDAYRTYIAHSRAELGIAKGAYVAGRSGWFSDRSAHYLASGKPVLAQSTGFEQSLPTGEGLLTFATTDDALAGIVEINCNYAHHRRAARAFAQRHLDAKVVLSRFVEIATS